MDRREFLETTALFAASLSLGRLDRVLAEDRPDLVALKGGEPAAMFDRGIEALGGMKAFVKKGQKVLLKPNIGWGVPPEQAANTNPQLVARIVEQCKAAGAGAVYVFDNTCDEWSHCYKVSGIETAAKGAGAVVAPANSESYYHEVKVPGRTLAAAKVHELLQEADVFINVPILKNHGSMNISAGMKNQMGVVWDRYGWHAVDVNQCIADFAGFRKPDLVVVDAYNVLKRNGPRGTSAADVLRIGAQLLGTDQVAVDAAAARLYGTKAEDVRHIALAEMQGRGRTDLEHLAIRRIVL